MANALVELATVLQARDRPVEATRALRRALAILRAPSDDLDLVRLRLQARIALAGLDRGRGAYGDANRGFQRALAETRRRLPRAIRSSPPFSTISVSCAKPRGATPRRSPTTGR